MKKAGLIAFAALIIAGCASTDKTDEMTATNEQKAESSQLNKTMATNEQKAESSQPNKTMVGIDLIAEFAQIMELKPEIVSNNMTNIHTLRKHAYSVSSVSFSHDGSMLVSGSGSDDGTITLWRISDGREIRTLRGHDNWVSSTSFNPDGSMLASGSGDDTVKLWRVSDGREIRTLRGHSDHVWTVSFSPDGSMLASGSTDNTIKLWRVSDGQEIRTLKGHDYSVYSVTFSPDGSMLASGSLDETLKLWRVSDGREIRTLKGHDDTVKSVTFSPDGSMLASGSGSALTSDSSDDTVKLWQVSDGREIRTLKGHDDRVNSVTFSPDGSMLASGSYDDTVKLWRVSDGREIRTLRGHALDVNSVTFSPDGSILASGSDGGAVKLWRRDMAYIYQESLDTPEYRISEEAFTREIRATPLAPAWELFTQHGPEALAYYKEHGLEAARLNADFNLAIAPDDIKAILNSPSPWPQALDRLVQSRISPWLNLDDQDIPEMVPQPVLPAPIHLTQEQWEFDDEFDRRVQAAKNRRQGEIDQIEDSYRQQVEARNRIVRQIQKLQADRKSRMEQARMDLTMAAANQLFTHARVTSAKLDQTNKGLYLSIVLPQKNSVPLGDFVLPNPSLDLRKQALSDASSLSAVPYAFANRDGGFGIAGARLAFGGTEHTLKPGQGATVAQSRNTAVIGTDDALVDLSQIALQNSDLVDRNAVGSITYKDGTTSFIDFQDDLTPLVEGLRPAPLDNSKWAFIVGAEEYKNTDNILYARRSAELFAKAIQLTQGIPKGHIRALYDQEATSGNLKTSLQHFLEQGIQSGDTVYFYYNGHGIPAIEQGSIPYILPTDMMPDYVAREPFFQVQNLYRIFENSKAGKVVMFFDSCFTGKADGVPVFKSVAASLLSPKKITLSSQGKIMAMAAGTDRQFSNVYREKGHRLFTYYLIKAMAERTPKTGSDLYYRVKQEVSTATRNMGPSRYQDPTLAGNGGLDLR